MADRVSFRRWGKRNGGGVLAILWDVPATFGHAMMFEHVGQHGEGTPSVVGITKPAQMSEPDVAALHQELTERGYELVVVERRPAR